MHSADAPAAAAVRAAGLSSVVTDLLMRDPAATAAFVRTAVTAVGA